MLIKTPECQAAEYANSILNVVNQTLARAQVLIANGAAANAQTGTPAVTAESIVTALGPVNVTVLQLIRAAAATTDTAKLQAATAALA